MKHIPMFHILRDANLVPVQTLSAILHLMSRPARLPVSVYITFFEKIG